MGNFNLLEGRTKEWNSDNYQGRRKDQYESTSKVMTVGCIGMCVIIVSLIMYGILF